MAYPNNQQANTGQFIPTTSIFEMQRVESIDTNSPEFKQLIVRLYQAVNVIALAVNLKDTGFYIEEEFATGQMYFNPLDSDPLELRPVFRSTFNTGPLNAGLTVIAHNLPITNTWQFVHIYGAANDTVGGNYFPMPTFNILLTVDAVNININNGSGINFTNSTVVLEYLKM